MDYFKKKITPRKMTEKLKELERITEFLQICLNSASIKDEKPIPVMLVSPVSNGKTTAVKQFKNNKNVLITTDSTAYGILKNYEKQLQNAEISYIIVPDLLTMLAKKKVTADSFILFVNNSSEDGIFPSKSYGIEIKDYIEPFGWIICITEEAYQRKLKFLDNIGFTSRFLILKHRYTKEQIEVILKRIIAEETKLNHIPNVKIIQSKRKVEIAGNAEIFEKALVYSKLLTKTDNPAEILRIQRLIQTFLKASALTDNRREVSQADLTRLEKLIDLIK